MMTDVYKPHISGITNYISLNKHFLELVGHEVFVFTFGDIDYEDDESQIIRSSGFPIVDTGYYLSLRYNRQAKRLLQSMDLVHVHHPFLSGNLALRYCRPLHIPIIFTNHTRYDLYAHAYLPLLPEVISDKLLQTYMPSFCEAMDLVISPSSGMAEVLRQLGVKSEITIVPNGVELERFHQPAPIKERSDLGFSADEVLLVYTGRLGPEKNIEFLIKTFSGTAEAVRNIRLIIIGSGPEEEIYREKAARTNASERILFLGRLDYNQLPAYLSICDIFVTASLTEVHPLSVIEAMASGLPVLGIDSVGVGDTVEPGVTGLLSSNDPAAFASMMTRLCLDAELRHILSLGARKASKKYAIEYTTQTMLEYYQRLVNKAVPRKRGLRYRIRSLMELIR